jgi:hypothetical protein
MDEATWEIIRILMFTSIGLIIGFGCKRYVCSDEENPQIQALEDELDQIELRNTEFIRNLENVDHVIAVPVEDSI